MFAGGLPIDSGHGIIYSTNITPDKTRGIGNLTEREFTDMVRKGVKPDGSYLYPAMPYPSYARTSDADMKALYAYLMGGVKPSDYVPPANTMSFPFNLRSGCASGTGSSRPMRRSRRSRVGAPISPAAPTWLKASATAAVATRRAASR